MEPVTSQGGGGGGGLEPVPSAGKHKTFVNAHFEISSLFKRSSST